MEYACTLPDVPLSAPCRGLNITAPGCYDVAGFHEVTRPLPMRQYYCRTNCTLCSQKGYTITNTVSANSPLAGVYMLEDPSAPPRTREYFLGDGTRVGLAIAEPGCFRTGAYSEVYIDGLLQASACSDNSCQDCAPAKAYYEAPVDGNAAFAKTEKAASLFSSATALVPGLLCIAVLLI